jgi:hypothetical protein
MDYMRAREMIEIGPNPGSYDIAAIRYLYGLSATPPAQPFCTDERVDVDPLCRQRDATADPLHLFYPADYASAIALFTSIYGELDASTMKYVLDQIAGGLMDFVRYGSPEDAEFAWQTAIHGLGSPLGPADVTPEHVAISDLVMAWLLDAVADHHPAAVEPALIEQATRIALDADHVRPRETRAAMIAALRKMQSHAAYTALLDVRGALAASLQGGTLPPEQALDVQDLIERVDRATSPYFD